MLYEDDVVYEDDDGAWKDGDSSWNDDDGWWREDDGWEDDDDSWESKDDHGSGLDDTFSSEKLNGEETSYGEGTLGEGETSSTVTVCCQLWVF